MTNNDISIPMACSGCISNGNGEGVSEDSTNAAHEQILRELLVSVDSMCLAPSSCNYRAEKERRESAEETAGRCICVWVYVCICICVCMCR